MDDQELRKRIEQLHAEIENTHTVDKKGQELLLHLDADIRELLERTGEDRAQVRPTTVERMEESLNHFEATHPALTTLLTELLESLRNAGI
jgi:hypothetical protein